MARGAPPAGTAGAAVGYRVRPARAGDLAALPEVERASAGLFPPEDLPAPLRDEVHSPAELGLARRERRLLVALDPGGAPVGFALAGRLDGVGHLEELSVHPDHGRRGLGSRLLEATCRWAARQGLRAVTLTTFRHLPWNAPFYARRGFRVLSPDELGPGLRAVLRGERARGLRRRVAMRRPLGPGARRRR